MKKIVKNINPYLVEGNNILIASVNKPISDLSPIVFGSTLMIMETLFLMQKKMN